MTSFISDKMSNIYDVLNQKISDKQVKNFSNKTYYVYND